MLEIHGEQPPSKNTLEALRDYVLSLGYKIHGSSPIYWTTWDAAGKVVGYDKLPIECFNFQRT